MDSLLDCVDGIWFHDGFARGSAYVRDVGPKAHKSSRGRCALMKRIPVVTVSVGTPKDGLRNRRIVVSAGLLAVAMVAVLLAVENAMVRANDFSRVNLAFFTVNGIISVGLGIVAIADVLFDLPPAFNLGSAA